ncbi:hypothetical protein [Rhodococcus sp. NPDC060176]|uniref:hypothetical protein n=1 Tax=Rhodococcus sp. NPDC060176 TaxID=3347062 RepID=UPI00365717F4
MFGFTQSAIPPNGTINEATPVTGFAPSTATSVDVTLSAFCSPIPSLRHTSYCRTPAVSV